MKKFGVLNCTAAASVLFLAGALGGNAQTVTMNVDNYTTYSVATSVYVGIYQFNVSAASAGTVPLGNFWSVCISPDGTLSGGTDPVANAYTYNYETFNSAAPGLNGPGPWAGSSVGNGGYGVQNAQYLWQVFGSASSALSGTLAPGTVGSTQERSAGLAAAMYVALYDSTAIGAANVSGGIGYDPIAALGLGSDANVVTDMNADLSALNPTEVNDHLAAGFILDPTNPNPNGPSGQSFIILVTNMGNVVPEPATCGILAGASMLAVLAGNSLRKKKN